MTVVLIQGIASSNFYRSSIDVINRFNFNPNLENGAPVEVHNIQYVFRYNLPVQ